MPTVVIEPKLYRHIEKAAAEHHAEVDTLFTEAIRRYLWELDRRKISEESKRYRQQHATLKAQYLGQYIAMRNGQGVDHDPDFQTLRQRVRRRFDDEPVMITLVEEAWDSPLVRRGFRTEV